MTLADTNSIPTDNANSAIQGNAVAIIVGKKWDPGILDPSPFSTQIRKVEARLGKLEVRPNLGWEIRKIEPN